MAQQKWIARAGYGLLDVLGLLLRGIGALCTACISLFLAAASHYEPESSVSDDGEALPDGLSMTERDEYAQTNGWNSW